MPKKKVLVSWLGSKDMYQLSMSDPAKRYDCSLASVLLERKTYPFDELCLFISSDPPKEDKPEEREAALCSLANLCLGYGIKLRRYQAEVNARAASPEGLLEFSIGALSAAYPDPERYEFFYNITSGTTLMATMQFHLSLYSQYKGDALYTFPKSWVPAQERNVYSAQLPSRLARLETEVSEDEVYIEPNRRIYDQILHKVADTEASVLIVGETGVGKTALAEYIHKHDSRRSRKEMITLNCAMFSDSPDTLRSELFGHVKGSFTDAKTDRQGAFEKADKGILFLDEIGEMPLKQQGALLRALDKGKISPLGSAEEKVVDVRIISATNVDLASAIREGRFREDLYYRLAQYTPRLKSIREYTREQKEGLLHNLLQQINIKSHRREPRRFSPEALQLLLAYDWPGNIREMKARLGSICLLSSNLIEADDVREQILVRGGGSGAFVAKVGDSTGKCDESQIPCNLKKWLAEQETYWLEMTRHYYPVKKEAAARIGLPLSTYISKLGSRQRN